MQCCIGQIFKNSEHMQDRKGENSMELEVPLKGEQIETEGRHRRAVMIRWRGLKMEWEHLEQEVRRLPPPLIISGFPCLGLSRSYKHHHRQEERTFWTSWRMEGCEAERFYEWGSCPIELITFPSDPIPRNALTPGNVVWRTDEKEQEKIIGLIIMLGFPCCEDLSTEPTRTISWSVRRLHLLISLHSCPIVLWTILISSFDGKRRKSYSGSFCLF